MEGCCHGSEDSGCAVLYGCVSVADIPMRVKTTLKMHKDERQPTKAYSYEITNVEVLKGNAECAIQPSDKTSTFDVGILLNGVCDVNGASLLPGAGETLRKRNKRNSSFLVKPCI